MLVFGERGKPEYPGKTSHSRVENQQTQSTFDAKRRNRTRATLLEGKVNKNKNITKPCQELEVQERVVRSDWFETRSTNANRAPFCPRRHLESIINDWGLLWCQEPK